MEAIGAIRWPLRTGSDARPSPGGSASFPPRSKPALRSAFGCLTVASEIVADLGEERLRRPRHRPGAPRHRGREPPGARLREGAGEARASEVGASRRRSRSKRHRASGVRAFRVPVSALSRREAGSTRWVGEARASPPVALEPRDARRTPGPRGLRQPPGDRDGARAPHRSGGDPRTPDGRVDVDRRGCGHRPGGARAPHVEEASPGPDPPCGRPRRRDGRPSPSDRSTPARATAFSARATRRRRADPDHAPSGGRAVRARE